MKDQRLLFIAVVVLTMAAWGCWQAMEIVPDNSPIETTLLVTGYLACALALVAFFKAMKISKT